MGPRLPGLVRREGAIEPLGAPVDGERRSYWRGVVASLGARDVREVLRVDPRRACCRAGRLRPITGTVCRSPSPRPRPGWLSKVTPSMLVKSSISSGLRPIRIAVSLVGEQALGDAVGLEGSTESFEHPKDAPRVLGAGTDEDVHVVGRAAVAMEPRRPIHRPGRIRRPRRRLPRGGRHSPREAGAHSATAELEISAGPLRPGARGRRRPDQTPSRRAR